MRHTAAVVLLGLLALGSRAQAQPAPQPEEMFCVGDTVPLRAERVLRSRRLGRVARGTRLRVIARSGPWVQVKPVGGGVGGWLPARALSANRPAPLRLTDQQVRRLLIRESIARYEGNCPCPYFEDSIGRACGGRSAWSRAGGQEPFCYPRDVSAQAVSDWRARNQRDDAPARPGAASDGPGTPRP